MQIFWTSSIVSNYLCDRFRHFVPALGFERLGPYILTQHIGNGENIVVISVESHIRTHLDHIRLTQVIESESSRKISSRRSVQFINQQTFLRHCE